MVCESGEIAIGTSDTALALVLLRELDATKHEYVVLHHAEDLLALEPVSDVDIATSVDAKLVIGALSQVSELTLIMAWQYDHGSYTSIWTTPDGRNGVQLDILSDADGVNRLGLCSNRLVEIAARDSWPPRLASPYKEIYVGAKAASKRQRSKLVALSSSGGLIGAMRAVGEVARPRRAAELRELFSSPERTRFPARSAKWRSRLSRRGIRRLARPAGVLVKVGGPSVGEVASALTPLRGVVIDLHVCQRSFRSRIVNRMRALRPVLIVEVDPEVSSPSEGWASYVVRTAAERARAGIGVGRTVNG